MSRYSVDQARADLAGLVHRAAAGEPVTIQHGADVVELRPAAAAADPVADGPAPGQNIYDWLRERRESIPPLGITSVELIDEMYNEDRR